MEKNLTPAATNTEVAAAPTGPLTKFGDANNKVLKHVEALACYKVIENSEQRNEALIVATEAAKVEKAIEAKRKELVKPLNDQVAEINGAAKLLTAQLTDSIQATKQSVLTWQKKEEQRVKDELLKVRKAQLQGMGFIEEDDKLVYPESEIWVSLSAISIYNPEGWVRILTELADEINNHNQAKLQKLQQESVSEDDLLLMGADESEIEQAKQTTEEAVAKVAGPVVLDHIPAAQVIAESSKAKGAGKRWVFEVTEPNLVPRQFLQVDETAIRNAVKTGVRMIPGVRIYQEDTLTLR